MKALLIKEYYTAGNNARQLLLLFAMGVVFLVAANDGGNYLSMMLSLGIMMSAYTSFTYDDTANWNRYAVCLPVKRSTIVASKYLFVLCNTLLSFALIAVLFLFSFAFYGAEAAATGLNSAATNTLVMLLTLCCAIPFIYKFGVEKARFFTLAFLLIPIIALVFLYQLSPAIFTYGHFPQWVLLPAVIFAVAIALPVSFYFSFKIFTAKEF